jgi:hypothetical protein
VSGVEVLPARYPARFEERSEILLAFDFIRQVEGERLLESP